MKQLLSILCFCAVFSLKAQDTIYFKNGEFAAGKVLEITPTEIKYKKAQIPDGPVYVSYKSDVALIQYKNGYKEVLVNTNMNMPAVPQPVHIPVQQTEEVKEAKTPMEPELKYYPYGNHRHYPVERPKK